MWREGKNWGFLLYPQYSFAPACQKVNNVSVSAVPKFSGFEDQRGRERGWFCVSGERACVCKWDCVHVYVPAACGSGTARTCLPLPQPGSEQATA